MDLHVVASFPLHHCAVFPRVSWFIASSADTEEARPTFQYVKDGTNRRALADA